MEVFTVKEVATMLKLAEITIRHRITRGEIKSIKIGRSRRISKEEVDRLLEGK